MVRDRSFNLQGGGGLWFICFVQNYFFLDNARVKIYLLSPEFNIRLYDKNSESDFFFLPQNQNIFFSNIGNQNIFSEKKHTPPPPPPLEVKWSVPFEKTKAANGIQQRSYISFFWSGVCVFGSFVKCSRVWAIAGNKSNLSLFYF